MIVATDREWWEREAATSPTGLPPGYVSIEAVFWADHVETLVAWLLGAPAAYPDGPPGHANCRCVR